MKRAFDIAVRVILYIPLVLAWTVAAVITAAAALVLGLLVQR